MYDFIRDHQLNIMLLLCGACAILAFIMVITRFLPKRRKKILILMEVMAFFLLWFDRMAYIYAGDVSNTGYTMVRLSNFFVFFLTPALLLGLNLFLADLLLSSGEVSTPPVRLKIVSYVSVLGMVLSVVSALTGLYYYFDEVNVYHRGSGFLIAYIIPVICPLIQFTVIHQYRKSFSRLIYAAMALYIFVPLGCGILQIFTYGISIVNMAMVLVSLSLYVFNFLDINDTVIHAHEIEIANMQGEQDRMKRLFDQTAMAFVSAVEKKDDFTKGNAVKIAEYARKIAEMAGKDEEYCEKVYYTALLHDVGMIGVPDSVIKNEEDPNKWDYEAMRKKPVIGNEILSSITEYPYLKQGAYSSHERYNGTGYPEGLKGEEIPEMARIVAVADAFVTMTSKKRYREARPVFVAREAMIKGAGESFDPEFAEIMVKIIDSETADTRSQRVEIEKFLSCDKYRDSVSGGIPVNTGIKRISFNCALDTESGFSAPALILFNSYDKRIHVNRKAIDAYRYVEFCEIWFDDHSIVTEARNVIEKPIERDPDEGGEGAGYEVIAGRVDDHIKLKMKSPSYSKEVIIALPEGVNSGCIAITGENCEISDISVEFTGRNAGPEDIPRIADEVSFIDHLESDIKNVQIDGTRSASTEGVPIEERMRIRFHAMTLPSAELVWHCPYVVIFSSEDGQVDGEGYREYALIKLNGEIEEHEEGIKNTFKMKRDDSFPGWDKWKEVCKAGMECELSVRKKGHRIMLATDNLGIHIEDSISIPDMPETVYLALTGDQVALTDIRTH